jgi:hypothetical protein
LPFVIIAKEVLKAGALIAGVFGYGRIFGATTSSPVTLALLFLPRARSDVLSASSRSGEEGYWLDSLFQGLPMLALFVALALAGEDLNTVQRLSLAGTTIEAAVHVLLAYELCAIRTSTSANRLAVWAVAAIAALGGACASVFMWNRIREISDAFSGLKNLGCDQFDICEAQGQMHEIALALSLFAVACAALAVVEVVCLAVCSARRPANGDDDKRRGGSQSDIPLTGVGEEEARDTADEPKSLAPIITLAAFAALAVLCAAGAVLSSTACLDDYERHAGLASDSDSVRSSTCRDTCKRSARFVPAWFLPGFAALFHAAVVACVFGLGAHMIARKA